jgi:IS30 family transposase
VNSRNKSGQFVKKSVATKAKELQAQGKTNAQIAKALGTTSQVIFRALNRAKFQTKRIVVNDRVRAARDEENECTNELCREGRSRTCECPCEGTWHGVPITA